MVKIEIYSLLGRTVVTTSAAGLIKVGDAEPHVGWTSLGYSVHEDLQSDEADDLVAMVGVAVEQANQRSCELGGWSVLVSGG